MSGQSLGSVIQLSLFAFGLMAVIALATAGFIALLVAGLASVGRRKETVAAVPVAAPAPPATRPMAPVAPGAVGEGIDPGVVVAIAAAIHTVVGAHRIIWIGETPTMGGWTGEVRQIHHGSHHPHHDR